jgi:hypothetical protein
LPLVPDDNAIPAELRMAHTSDLKEAIKLWIDHIPKPFLYVFSSSYQNSQVSYDLFDHEAYIISHQ